MIVPVAAVNVPALVNAAPVAFMFRVLLPPFKIAPAEIATVADVVCVNEVPRFNVPPDPVQEMPAQFTFPVKVAVPDVFVLDTSPVVTKPPIVCEAIVPTMGIAEDPKFTLALVFKLAKLPLPMVMVPVPVTVIVPVAEFVTLPPAETVILPVPIVTVPLLVNVPVVIMILPVVKVMDPLLIQVPVVADSRPLVPVIDPLLVQFPRRKVNVAIDKEQPGSIVKDARAFAGAPPSTG